MDRSTVRKRRDILQLTGYLVALYGVWSLCRFFILPFLEHFFPPMVQGIIDVVAELVVFVPPVLLYLRREGVSSVWGYLKLNTLSKGFFWCLLCLLAFLEMAISTVVYLHHRINVPYLLRVDNLLAFLLVGITEEIPFRGFLFQKLEPLCGSWGAIGLSALLFVGVHLPLWLMYPPPVPLPFAFLGITFIGIIYGIAFWKTRSLWSAIILHSGYNLAVALVTSALH